MGRFYKSLLRQSQGTSVHVVFFERLRANFTEEVRYLSTFVFGSPVSDAALSAIRREAFSTPAAADVLREIAEHDLRATDTGSACAFKRELRETTFAGITAMMHAR